MKLYQIYINAINKIQHTPIGHKNSSASKHGRYGTVCADGVANRALETTREGTASLYSNLELEEKDNPFNDCDLEAEKTRFSLARSTTLCIFFDAKHQ